MAHFTNAATAADNASGLVVMPNNPKPTPQVGKSRDLARELECDEDEGAFRAKFMKVATAPRPKPSGQTEW